MRKYLFYVCIAVYMILMLGCNEASSHRSPPALPIVNVYIDNTGSMNSFVAGSTNFEANLINILGNATNASHAARLHVSFLNTKPRPIDVTDTSKFVKSLEPHIEPFHSSIDEINSTHLDEMFGIVLESVASGSIAIFVSDTSYVSDNTSQVVESGIINADIKTKFINRMSKLSEVKFATIVVQMSATNNRPPYYVWFIGDDTMITKFVASCGLTNVEHSYHISDTPPLNSTYSILTNDLAPDSKGAYSIQDNSKLGGVKNDNLQFSIAVDFGNFPSYYDCAKKEKYQVTSGFEIVDIQEATSAIKNRFKYATHVITIHRIDNKIVKPISLELKNDGSWIAGNGTSGLSEIIDGIKLAYSPVQDTFLIITIPLER